MSKKSRSQVTSYPISDGNLTPEPDWAGFPVDLRHRHQKRGIFQNANDKNTSFSRGLTPVWPEQGCTRAVSQSALGAVVQLTGSTLFPSRDCQVVLGA